MTQAERKQLVTQGQQGNHWRTYQPPSGQQKLVYESAIETHGKIQPKALGRWKDVKFLLDTAAEINVISQHLVTELELTPIKGAKLPNPRMADNRSSYCYGAYAFRVRITDAYRREQTFESTFYSMEREGPPLILGMPALAQEHVVVDCATKQFRFQYDLSNMDIDSADQFGKALKDQPAVYAIMVAGINAPAASVPPALPAYLSSYADVFSNENAAQLAPFKEGDHEIDIGDQMPPYGPLYNLSNTELTALRAYLDDAMDKGWIRYSTSPAGSPVLFVPKKDGGLRLCVDYRGLNKITRKNRHALPLISETLDRLSGANWFSKFDLKDAFHRIRIKKGHEWKTAFRTRYGHFEYLVMPFGLANAPATFQAYINRALAGLVDVTCVVYLDDILVFSKTEAEHQRNVCEVLRRLRKFQLFVNLKKCAFSVKQIEFLGFIVSTQGVQMDPSRVEAIKDWPIPKTYRDIQVFLGFANFYRRFILRFGSVAAPLTGLLKGSKNGKKTGPFVWTNVEAQAFRSLCDAFTTAPILRHFDPTRKLRMETDASNFGLGAILSQQFDDGHWHPIAYWSRKMIPAERNYETHDQELLAIVAAFKQWRHYLEGSAFPIEVLTDHNNLRGFMNVKVLSPRQARWAVKLATYDFVITHRSGISNPADPPSRRPDYEGESQALHTLLPTLQSKLALTENVKVFNNWEPLVAALRHAYPIKWEPRQGQRKFYSRIMVAALLDKEDPLDETPTRIVDIIHDLQSQDEFCQRKRDVWESTAAPNRASLAPWSVTERGIVRHAEALYVPEDEAVRTALLQRYHDDALAGHFGYDRTLELIRRKYWWTHLPKDTKRYVETCDICQRVNIKRHRPYGEMVALPQPSGPWKEITMDFITGLPPSKLRDGRICDMILVIVDRYTKMALYTPCTKDLDASGLADILVDRVLTHFGTPAGIVSDRGSIFTSEFWSEFCYRIRVKRRLSTAFHPQTDGQTERQNQTLEQYLRNTCCEQQNDWARLLPLAQFAYNNSVHSSTRVTPFFALMAYHPEVRYEAEERASGVRVPGATERALAIQDARDTMAKRFKSANEAQARNYNKNHTPLSFKRGDLVLLSTAHLKLKQPSKKLTHRRIGPFRVDEPVGTQAYRLVLPTGYRIWPVFHVSLLEPYVHRDGDTAALMPLPELADVEAEYDVEEILDSRRRKGEVFYLIKWLDYGHEYNSWEPATVVDAPELLRRYNDGKEKKKAKAKSRRENVKT